MVYETWPLGDGNSVVYTEDYDLYCELLSIPRVEWFGTYSDVRGRDFAWQVRYPNGLKDRVEYVLKHMERWRRKPELKKQYKEKRRNALGLKWRERAAEFGHVRPVGNNLYMRGAYLASCSRKGEICVIHRACWEAHYGVIPHGMHIHHKDMDKENFDIANLQCLTPRSHTAMHLLMRRIGVGKENATKIIRDGVVLSVGGKGQMEPAGAR